MEINGLVEVVVEILLVCLMRFLYIFFFDLDFYCLDLGGIGGPYRLNGDHQVYQIFDDVKAAST